MERCLIIVIVVALAGITIQKKNWKYAKRSQREERRMPEAIAEYESSPACTGALTIYSQLKTSPEVFNEADVFETNVFKNRIQKNVKNWPAKVNKLTHSTNPRVLFNILRSLPMGEPYFIE
jgi:hypothetical protein